MQPLQRITPTLVPLVFALLAFIFSLLAITSPQWGARNQYANDTDSVSQVTPIYTLYRSPFQICGEVATVVNSTVPAANITDTDGNTDQPPPPQLNYTYESVCQHYRAFGFNRTSCELASVTQSKTVPQVGDRRLCQQIHYAGNFSITSTVFISSSFLLTLAIAVIGFLSTSNDDSGTSGAALTSNPSTADEADVEEEEEEEPRTKSGPHQVHDLEDGMRHRHHRHHHSSNNTSRTPVVVAQSPRPLFAASPYLTLFILTFSFIGVATALISQFYAVLAFTESSPNNADYASSTGNHEKHDPWVQGKALSIYMTLSWCFATAAGFGVHLLWRGPTWERL